MVWQWTGGRNWSGASIESAAQRLTVEQSACSAKPVWSLLLLSLDRADGLGFGRGRGHGLGCALGHDRDCHGDHGRGRDLGGSCRGEIGPGIWIWSVIVGDSSWCGGGTNTNG